MFKDLTIRKKLTLIIMFTSLIAIFLACVSFAVFDYYEHRKELIQDTQSLAGVIGSNCQAALKFDIPEDAEKMLAALIAKPSVAMAYVYDAKGNVFAAYVSPEKKRQNADRKAKPEGYYFADNYLEIHIPIYFDDNKIGSISLKDDMRDIKEGLKRDCVVLSIVICMTLTITYMIATKLQTFISEPILSLAQTAKKISSTKDYSLRAVKENNDEIGKLTDDFNNMITEVQASDNALRESELRFRDFFENAPIGFHIFGPDQRIIDINDAELEMIGYSRDEIVGKKNLTDLIIPSQKEMFKMHWDDIIKTGSAKNLEYTLIHKDGHHVNVILNASSRFDENGKLINTRGSILNITKRKKAEQQIEVLSRFPSENPSPVLRISNDGILLYANDASKPLLEMGNFDIGKKVPDQLKNAVKDTLKTKQKQFEVDCHGKTCSFYLSSIPEAKYTNLYGRDITEQKKAEQQIRQSEEKFRALVENTTDWIWEVDRNTTYTYSSPQIKEILGYTPGEVIGKTPLEFMPLAEAKRVGNLLANIVKSQKPIQSLENIAINKNGDEIILETSGIPLFDEHGALRGYRGIDRDITKRKKAEQEREELLKMLASQKEELESIIYVSSHDLKSPIFNIVGFSGELTSACTSLKQIIKNENISEENKRAVINLIDDDIPESLNFIKFGTSKLKALLDALLKVSRITRKEIIAETLDMDDMLDRIKQSMAFQIKQKEMTLTIEKLPKCIGDKAQIDQVFTNLIDNAIKYRDPNKKGNIIVNAQILDDRSVYCVKDNGMGMAADHQKKIFELFHRLNPKDNIEGQGLGLTIAKRIIQRHNGDIWVESAPGKGSAFFVALPAP